MERRKGRTTPSVIVIGGGIAGLAAARALHDASFQVSESCHNVQIYHDSPQIPHSAPFLNLRIIAFCGLYQYIACSAKSMIVVIQLLSEVKFGEGLGN